MSSLDIVVAGLPARAATPAAVECWLLGAWLCYAENILPALLETRSDQLGPPPGLLTVPPLLSSGLTAAHNSSALVNPLIFVPISLVLEIYVRVLQGLT